MSTTSRLFAFVRPYGGRVLVAVLLVVLAGALSAVVVAALDPLVNSVVLLEGPPHASPEPGGLERLKAWSSARIRGLGNPYVTVPAFMAVAFFLRALCLFFGTYLLTAAGAFIVRDLRTELYRAIVNQSQSFFRDHPSGSLLSRLLSDVQRVQRAMTHNLANAVRVAATMPFMLAVILIANWRMSGFVLLALPLLVVPLVRLSQRLRRASQRSQEKTAEVASLAGETITGIKVVQGFGMEGFEIQQFRSALSRLLRVDLRAARAAALAPSVIEVVWAISGGGLLLIAGRAIQQGSLDPGELAVIMAGLGMLFASLRILSRSNVELQGALAAAERIFQVVDHPYEIQDAPGAVQLAPFADALRFDGVAFAYEDREVLRGIDLTIRHGEVVALVGPSGAGKSTLVSLIPRFLDPTAGRLSIDGRDLRQVTLASLRDQIGLVTQETILFDASVRDNIGYGRSDVSLERIVEAARAAQAHDFIDKLPQGYDTALGELGHRLSVGQRQRLAIARALLKDPPILLLDEATSALDSESEVLVQKALEVLLKGRTSVIIAHRLSTVRQADRIVVLNAGRIVEDGSHCQLLERGGLYARLHELQFSAPPTRRRAPAATP